MVEKSGEILLAAAQRKLRLFALGDVDKADAALFAVASRIGCRFQLDYQWFRFRAHQIQLQAVPGA